MAQEREADDWQDLLLGFHHLRMILSRRQADLGSLQVNLLFNDRGDLARFRAALLKSAPPANRLMGQMRMTDPLELHGIRVSVNDMQGNLINPIGMW